jgi:hypothetical protein
MYLEIRERGGLCLAGKSSLWRAVDVMNADFLGFVDENIAMFPARVVDVGRIERRHFEIYD